MFCQKCGHEVQDSALFCPNCGKSLKNATSNGIQLPTIQLSRAQQITCIICLIWFIVWFFIGTITDYKDDKTLCYLVAIFVPILYLLVRWLISLLKKRPQELLNNGITSLTEFSKQFDGIRIETVFNKLSECTETYCVFYNYTRALFGQSLHNCSPDDFKKQMKDLIVVQQNGKYVIEQKEQQKNPSAE